LENKSRFSLVEFTDKWITRDKLSLPRGKHYYPSEASVEWIDAHDIKRVAGTCLRKSYFRIKGQPGGKADAYTEWNFFRLGKVIEQMMIEEWKQAGIWVENNLRFYDEELNISGEVDCVVKDPNTSELVVVECKTIYGWFATKEVCGSRGYPGQPKTHNALQALLYLHKFRNIFGYAKLIYYARDSSKRAEFDLDLKDTLEGTRFTINGVTDFRFTIEDIYARYRLLDQCAKSDTIPQNDYELIYSPEKIKLYAEIGDLSKTAMDKYKKGEEIPGDWQCRAGCPYEKLCWYKDGRPRI